MEMKKDSVALHCEVPDSDRKSSKALEESQMDGLKMHAVVDLSPEAKAAERRLVWKQDLFILPLLSLMYFLASMVCSLFGLIALQ